MNSQKSMFRKDSESSSIKQEGKMYDKDKIEDSLEFVNKIYLYEKCSPDKVSDMMKMQNVKRRDFDFQEYDKDEKSKEIYLQKEIPDEKEIDNLKMSLMDFVYIFACVVISVAIAFCITRYVAHHTRVEGSSMNETLYNGDYLIIEKMSYYFDEPERYDIIVFPYSKDVYYIKRVIGLPGEKIQIINGNVYINDELLSDDIYGNNPISDPGIAKDPIYIEEGQVFVLGDNRNSSIDSRRNTLGLIETDKIEGKAFFRIWPFSSFGKVK